MVGEKARSAYKRKRKGKAFSGTQRYEVKGEKPAPVEDVETPSTSGCANLSDSDSKPHWFIKEENGACPQQAFLRKL